MCAQDLNSKTGATVAQAIAASPLDNRTYVLAMFANDAAEAPQSVSHQAVAAWTSWLLVTTDNGHTWVRRELPRLQLPDLGDATGIESTLATSLSFGPDGVLHVAVSAQRGDAGLVSDGPIGGYDTPHPDATHPSAFLLQTPDLGRTWGAPKLLGAMYDYRFLEVAAHSSSGWMAVWDNRDGQLSFLATRDAGKTWEWGNETDDDGRCGRNPMMAKVADGLLTFCAQAAGSRLFHWSAVDGSWAQWAVLPADRSGTVVGSTLSSDGDREVAFAPFLQTPEAELSHDGGRTWPESLDLTEGLPNNPSQWYPYPYTPLSPFLDAHGRLHLLMPLRDQSIPESQFQLFHIVRQAVPGGKVLAQALYPAYTGVFEPTLGVGTLGPTQAFAFHGEDGFLIDAEGTRDYLVRVHLDEPT